jgi:hypothetical protein
MSENMSKRGVQAKLMHAWRCFLKSREETFIWMDEERALQPGLQTLRFLP